MTLGRIAADDYHQARVLDVMDRPRIAAVAHRAPKTSGGRRLAITGTIVDVISAYHRASQLLHQVTLFIGAFGRGNERERVRTGPCSDFGETTSD